MKTLLRVASLLFLLSAGCPGEEGGEPTGDTCCCRISENPLRCSVVAITSCDDGAVCTSPTACPSGQCSGLPHKTADEEPISSSEVE